MNNSFGFDPSNTFGFKKKKMVTVNISLTIVMWVGQRAWVYLSN